METLNSENNISKTGGDDFEGDAWLSIDLVSWQVDSSVTWDADDTLFDPQFYVCIDVDGNTDGISPECVWTGIWDDKIELNNSWNISFDLPEDFESINITIECWDNDESSDEWNDGNDACDLNADEDYWRMYYQTNFSDFTSENVTGSGYGDQNSQGSKGDASSIWKFSLLIYPDSDSDGVADQFDDCNQTPVGREVAANGCWWMEGDMDDDGILNPEDRCTGKFGGCILGSQYIIQGDLLNGVSWFHTNGEIMTLIDTDLDNGGIYDYQVVNENGELTNFTAGIRGTWEFGGMSHQSMKGYSPNGDYMYYFSQDSQSYCDLGLYLVNGSKYHEKSFVTNLGPCHAATFAQERLYVWMGNGDLIYYEHDDLDAFVKGNIAMAPSYTKIYTSEDIHDGGWTEISANPSGTNVIFRYSINNNGANIAKILDTTSNSVSPLPISISSWEDRTGFISDRHFFDTDYYFDIISGSTTELDLPNSAYNKGDYPVLSYNEDGVIHLKNPVSNVISTVLGCENPKACGSSGGIFLVSPDGNRILFGGTWYEEEYHGVPYVVGYIDSDLDGIPDIDDTCPNTDIDQPVNENGCADNQKDDDSDGILNSNDNCPNTANNVATDDLGCAEYQLDDDIDGVANDIDTCPNTQGGETVNLSGCSASQVDTDGDGVYDSQDNCPSTSSETTVDSTGCAPDDVVDLDSDEDGIRDSVDACPNSAMGIIVDSTGCETIENSQELDDEVSSEDLSNAFVGLIGLLVVVGIVAAAVVGIKSLTSSSNDSYDWDYGTYGSVSNQSIPTPQPEPNLELKNVVAELERQRKQSEREIRQLKQQQSQQSSASEIATMQQEMQALQQRVADSEQAKLQLQNEIEQVKIQKDDSINMQDSVVGGDMVTSGGQKIESQTNVMGTDPETIARIIFEAQEKERERLRMERNE